MQNLRPLGLIVIKRERTLISIRSQKICRLAAYKRRTPTARLVSCLPALDFDNVGAEVSQHHGAVGPSQSLSHFDHANRFQNLHQRLHHGFRPKQKTFPWFSIKENLSTRKFTNYLIWRRLRKHVAAL